MKYPTAQLLFVAVLILGMNLRAFSQAPPKPISSQNNSLHYFVIFANTTGELDLFVGDGTHQPLISQVTTFSSLIPLPVEITNQLMPNITNVIHFNAYAAANKAFNFFYWIERVVKDPSGQTVSETILWTYNKSGTAATAFQYFNLDSYPLVICPCNNSSSPQ